MKKQKTLKRVLISVLLIVCFIASSCSHGGGNGNDQTADNGTTEAPVPVQVEEKDKMKIQLYAAPEALGTGDGSSAENAIGGLEEAVKASREIDGDVTVNLAEGEYYLRKTLKLTEEDSGTTFLGEGAVITSSLSITGWTDAGDGIVCADLSDSELTRFTQFYVNGTRRERTRWPEEGILIPAQSQGKSTGWANEVTGLSGDELALRQLFFKKGDIPSDIYRVKDVEFVILQYWMEARLYVQNINFEQSTAVFTSGSWRPLTWSYGYYLENVKEGLNVPGRWYLDRGEKKIYYHLQDGETADGITASAAKQRSLVEISPSTGKTVDGLRFVGVTFSGTDAATAGGYHSVQAETNAPAAVYGTALINCEFSQCIFKNLAGYALWLRAGSKYNTIDHCRFTHLGGGAIRIGELERPANDYAKVNNNTVSNCRIDNCGEFYLGPAGIMVGQSGFNTITHNDISGQMQWAISLGWNWSIFPLNESRGNRVSWNHVHDIGTGILGCHGAIYMLGVSPETVVEYNLVENIYASEWWAAGQGITLDNSCSGITIQNNIVRNANAGGWGCNFDSFGNIIRNNIFAFGVDYQMTRYGDNPPADPPPNGEVFSQNIVIYETGSFIRESSWPSYKTFWDYNLYWCTSGEVRIMHTSFASWQKKGMDTHSKVADPLFADAKNGDFTLAPNSPAYSIGFQPFSLDGVGIQPIV